MYELVFAKNNNIPIRIIYEDKEKNIIQRDLNILQLNETDLLGYDLNAHRQKRFKIKGILSVILLDRKTFKRN